MNRRFFVFFLFALIFSIQVHANKELTKSLSTLKNRLTDLAMQLAPEEKIDPEKVSIIQAVLRGKQARDEYTKLKKATESIQALLKGHLEQQKFKKLKQATTTIQALMRGKLDRNKFQKTQDEVKRVNQIFFAAEELKKAAVTKINKDISTIQAVIRGKLARDELEKAKKLDEEKALIIQSALRGKRARDEYAKLKADTDLDTQINKIAKSLTTAKKQSDFENIVQLIQSLQLKKVHLDLEYMIKNLHHKTKSFNDPAAAHISAYEVLIELTNMLLKQNNLFLEDKRNEISQKIDPNRPIKPLIKTLKEIVNILEIKQALCQQLSKQLPQHTESTVYKKIKKNRLLKTKELAKARLQLKKLKTEENEEKVGKLQTILKEKSMQYGSYNRIKQEILELTEKLKSQSSKFNTLIRKANDRIRDLDPQKTIRKKDETPWHDQGLTLEQQMKKEEEKVISDFFSTFDVESVDLTKPLELPKNISLFKKNGFPKSPSQVISELKTTNQKLAYLLNYVDIPEFKKTLSSHLVFEAINNHLTVKQEAAVSHAYTAMALSNNGQRIFAGSYKNETNIFTLKQDNISLYRTIPKNTKGRNKINFYVPVSDDHAYYTRSNSKALYTAGKPQYDSKMPSYKHVNRISAFAHSQSDIIGDFKGQVYRMVNLLYTHKNSPVSCVTLTPNAKKVISSAAQEIIYYTLDSQKLIQLTSHKSDTTALAADGNYIFASGSSNGSLFAWNILNSKSQYLVQKIQVYKKDPIDFLAFGKDKDGDDILISASSKNQTVTILNTETNTWKIIKTIDYENKAQIIGINIFKKDKTKALIFFKNGEIGKLDLTTYKTQYFTLPDNCEIDHLIVNDEKNFVALKSLHQIQTRSLVNINKYLGKQSFIKNYLFDDRDIKPSSNKEIIPILNFRDNVIQIYNLATGKTNNINIQAFTTSAIPFNSGNHVLTLSDKDISIIDNQGNIIAQQNTQNEIKSLALSDDEKLLVTCSENDQEKTVILWTIDQKSQKITLKKTIKIAGKLFEKGAKKQDRTKIIISPDQQIILLHKKNTVVKIDTTSYTVEKYYSRAKVFNILAFDYDTNMLFIREFTRLKTKKVTFFKSTVSLVNLTNKKSYVIPKFSAKYKHNDKKELDLIKGKDVTHLVITKNKNIITGTKDGKVTTWQHPLSSLKKNPIERLYKLRKIIHKKKDDKIKPAQYWKQFD